MTLNNEQYSNPLWVAHNSDPAYDIQFYDCQNKGYVPQEFVQSLKGVHIPDKATPSPGTDSQLSIFNPDSGRYVDLWVAKKEGGVWKACWGGSIANAATSDTSFPYPLGASASGLALEPYTVKVSELQAGHIDHPVAMALPPEVINSYVSKPANRTDGNLNPGDPATISEGQYLRLPANFNIDALKLNRTQRIMAQAAKEHGFIVVDRAHAVTFSFQNKSTFDSDPYPALFGGMANWNVMWGDPTKGEQPFPFDSLQVLQRDYLPNGPATGGGGSTTTPTPTPTPTAPSTPTPTPTPTPTAPSTPTTPAPSPSTPAPSPTAPAGGSVSVTGYKGGTSFGFRANLPQGARMVVTWTHGGQGQYTTTQAKDWWSGPKPGWSNAKAVVLDSSNKVIGSSEVLNP